MRFGLTETLKQQDISQTMTAKRSAPLSGAPCKSLRTERQLVAEDIGGGVKFEANHPSVHNGDDGTP